MKSKIQFVLSMIIFGTIGVFVRYIDLSSSEIALLRGQDIASSQELFWKEINL